MTTAGKRTRRILFERPSVTTDGYGGEILDWENGEEIAAAFAEVMFGTGRERREAAQEAGSQAATFIVQWTPTLAGVALKDRISGLGATWDITSVAPVGLNKELHFTAVRNA